MKGKGQKCVLLLAVVGGLLSLVPCRAQEAQAGRYQLSVAVDDGATVLYLMDSLTGDIFKKSMRGEDEWRYFSAIPPSAVLDEVKAEHERKTAAEKERAAKRTEEIKAEREAISTLFRTGTLEEQVRAAKVIRVIRYGDDLEIAEVLKKADAAKPPVTAVEEKDFDTSTPRGARAAREAQKREEDRVRVAEQMARMEQAAEMAASQVRESPRPMLRPPSRIIGNTFSGHTWDVLSDIPMEKGEVFVSFLVKDTFFEVIFASERLKLPEPEFKGNSVLVLPSKREPSELVKEIKAILAKEE